MSKSDQIKRTNNYDIYKDLPEDLKSNFKSSIEYIKLISAFNKFMMNYIIYTGKSVVLPYSCGELVLLRKKSKLHNKQYVDFNHFNKTGEKRKFTNKHSEGYFATMKWFRNFTKFKGVPHAGMLLFTINDDIKHDLVNAINNHNTIYKYAES